MERCGRAVRTPAADVAVVDGIVVDWLAWSPLSVSRVNSVKCGAIIGFPHDACLCLRGQKKQTILVLNISIVFILIFRLSVHYI